MASDAPEVKASEEQKEEFRLGKEKMYNVMEGKKLSIDGLLDGKGCVKLINVGPMLAPEGRTPEYMIARAARTSYDSDNRSAKADEALVEYLARHQHTSPLEMCNATFFIKLPIFVCRQLARHRTFKINEFSQRYTEVTEDVDRFRLDGYEQLMRGKAATNHQGSEFNLKEEQIKEIDAIIKEQEELQDRTFANYKKVLDAGLCKELARCHLPVSTYTKIFVQCDVNNLKKFLHLRTHDTAQLEIRVYAEAMYEIVKQFFPKSMDIFDQYRDAVWLGKYEKEMIKTKRIPAEITSKSYTAQLRDLAEDLGIKLEN